MQISYTLKRWSECYSPEKGGRGGVLSGVLVFWLPSNTAEVGAHPVSGLSWAREASEDKGTDSLTSMVLLV